MKTMHIALIGAGNLGMSIYNGLKSAGFLTKNKLTLTRRNVDPSILHLSENAVLIDNNSKAVQDADIVILCVQPKQAAEVIAEIKDNLNKDQVIVSAVTGVSIESYGKWLGRNDLAIVRAMPNTAIAVGESMTCIASNQLASDRVHTIESIFNLLGQTLIVPENLLQAATIICASGTAFWMRFIRASCQGAVQLGFEAHIAQKLVMQTCLGGVKLLAHNGTHPEEEIDKVTTPGGCTVKGLNEMEHQGLSSAIIKGLETSFDQINRISMQSSSAAEL